MGNDSGSTATKGLTRRELVKRGAVLVGGTAIAPAYAGAAWARSLGKTANTIKIGFVSPITGATSGFGEPDPYVISLAKKAFVKGLNVGGTPYAVEIVQRDSQSAPSQAAKVANDLIHGQGVDLILATSTPETVNSGRRRGGGRSVRDDGRAVGGLVLRTRREGPDQVAVPGRHPLLLRRRQLL